MPLRPCWSLRAQEFLVCVWQKYIKKTIKSYLWPGLSLVTSSFHCCKQALDFSPLSPFILFSFDGRVVAKLPFVPLSYIQGLSHRNLLGEDYTDCSFIFLYILCTMSIRQVSSTPRLYTQGGFKCFTGQLWTSWVEVSSFWAATQLVGMLACKHANSQYVNILNMQICWNAAIKLNNQMYYISILY